MGLLDLLKGQGAGGKSEKDVIWLTKEARLAGIRSSIARSLAKPQGPAAILLVGHFADCLGDLRQLRDELEGEPPVLVVDAVGLAAPESARLVFEADQQVEIIVAERHPLASHDAMVAAFAAGLACRASIVHHLSLDDALLRPFASERVKSMLARLGMQAGEPIESHLVTRQIAAAQQKLERQCASDRPADSAQAWLELNCPGFAALE